MLKVNSVGKNQTELIVNETTVTVFFSYKTPVACFIKGKGYFKTRKNFSKTTTKHINKWLIGEKAQEKPQDFFDNLLNDIK